MSISSDAQSAADLPHRAVRKLERTYLLTWLATSPESPVHIDLRPLIPAFAWADLTWQPLITGRIFAAALFIVLGCALIQELGWKPPQGQIWRTISPGPGWLGGLALLAAGWYVMNYDFLKHKTVLAEQKRWDLRPTLQQAAGIAYLNGKLFLADYAGRSVGELDVRTGAYPTLPLSSAHGAPRYGYPGDVAVGPQRLLYLLNNGPGKDALYVISPRGRVLREEPLEGKARESVGLAFDSHGMIYVGDMVGGVIRKYGPHGGKSLAAWGGLTGRFNNVAGIVMDRSGTIYAAESSANRVQQLDAHGRFIRVYDLECAPQHLALHGDWIDVTCSTGLVSIDRRSGNIQLSRVDENDPPLNSPTGLVYGPDNLLYILDGSTVVSYKVRH